jgi:hypothetical protein
MTVHPRGSHGKSHARRRPALCPRHRPAAGAFAADDDVVVGILEHLSPAQKKRLDDAYGDVGPAIVRVAFRKQAGRWQALPSDIGDLDQLKAATRNFPQKLDWTIAFDGKARGHLRSAAPPQWNFYSDVGVELVPRGSKVIAIGHPSTGFERWDSDKPVHRPLVLVTRPDTGDPDQWKPAKLDDTWSAAGIARLRAEVKAEASGLRFRDKDVKLVKAYGSKSGRVLFGLELSKSVPQADELPGPERQAHWFAGDTPQALKFLGSGLALIDTGDYDGDGHSELVFAKSGYNHDGYVLFSDDLAHSAEFGWSYH